LGAALFLSACAQLPLREAGDSFSMPAQWESGRFVLASSEGALVVIGISSRLARRADEIDAAKNDAARKVALFYGLEGRVEFFQRSGASVFDFIAESSVDLRPFIQDHERFLDRLFFDPDRDVLLFDSGSLVRFTYGAQVSRVATPSSRLDAQGRPEWAGGANLPWIAGHLTAVGFSQNQIWLRDTAMRSAQAAAARMIMAGGSDMRIFEIDAPGQGSVSYISSRSEGILVDFRIIEFWIDPWDMSVYTLAVGRLAR